MDPDAQEKRNHAGRKFWANVVLAIAGLLAVIGLAAGLPLALLYDGGWWALLGAPLIVGYILLLVSLLINPISSNKRFATSPESKKRAADALRELIPYWRNKAFLRGETTYRASVRTLTMREIREVYPHAKAADRGYGVEFDFGAEKLDPTP